MKLCMIAAFLVALATGAGAANAAGQTGPWVGAEAARENYDSGGDEGMVYSLAAGWDMALSDRWMTGIALRAVLDGVDETTTRTTATAAAVTRVSLEDQWNVSGRVGYRLSPAVLLFGEVGYERYRVDAVRTLRAAVCAPPDGCVINRLDGSFDEEMWTAGAGIEWNVTARVRARGSYGYGASDSADRNRFAVGVAWAF